MKRRVIGGNSCFPKDGLKHLWGLDGNVNDTVGGAHGTIAGGMTYENGVLGKCAVFNGNNYITLPLDLSLTKFTISFWCRLYSYVQFAGIIMYRGSNKANGIATPGAIDGMGYNPIGFIMQYANAGSLKQYLEELTLPDLKNFKHIVINSDDSIYINSVKYKMKLAHSSGNYKQLDLYNGTCIGFDSAAPDRILKGNLQQILIYDRLLSDDEVFLLYNNGNGLNYQ